MELRITTLIENMPDDSGKLQYEHGLSLYIEFQGRKLLFDTGQSGAFLNNARKLNKAVDEVDWVIVSHGHYDHSGGVYKLARELKREIPIYVGQEFFDKKYKLLEDGSYHYNGNPFEEQELKDSRLCVRKVTEDVTYLTENIILFKNFKRRTDFEAINPKFFIGKGTEYKQDLFMDELVLGLLTTKGLVLVVGCSHVGIINILEDVSKRVAYPIYAVLGGTHLVEADERRLTETIKTLKACKLTQIAVSHCTGEEGIGRLSEEFGERFIWNNTGNVYRMP